MRIVQCDNDNRFDVFCYACGKRGNYSTMLADLDGPAYKAYYHADCMTLTPNGAYVPRNVCGRKEA